MGNIFGNVFRFITYGESYSSEIGCVLDGVPSQIALSVEDIQPYLNKRKPGSSKFVSQRKEPDIVEIRSGIFKGITTGAPICLAIKNQDLNEDLYEDIKDKFRPGHADYTVFMKYGVKDYLGGGRSSARETACRVAAGAVARKILGDTKIIGALTKIGNLSIDHESWDWDEIKRNDFHTPDKEIVNSWQSYIQEIRKNGSSIGSEITLTAFNMPVGLGAPVYDKLSADIAKALMGINGVKAVEIGDGFDCINQRGEEHADQMRKNQAFMSNHAGGILGGISTGNNIVIRLALKPASSILHPLSTIDTDFNETQISTKGKHDPCIGIRAVAVAEAMLALTLADHTLMMKTTRL